MSKKYPEDYLKACGKEMFAIISNDTENSYDDALNYFKDLYRQTYSEYPYLASDCVKETMKLAYKENKQSLRKTIFFLIDTCRYTIDYNIATL